MAAVDGHKLVLAPQKSTDVLIPRTRGSVDSRLIITETIKVKK